MPPKSRSILTPAQWVVLERLARGESRETIARVLGITPGTVKAHTHAINQRLRLGAGLKRTMAVVWYLREGRQRRQQEEGE